MKILNCPILSSYNLIFPRKETLQVFMVLKRTSGNATLAVQVQISFLRAKYLDKSSFYMPKLNAVW